MKRDLIIMFSNFFESVFRNIFFYFSPTFFLDVTDMLNGVRCDSVIKTLPEKNIRLFDFLSSTYDDLKDWGITLPYQRERIMGGLHKFHQHPYHPDSLHVVPLNVNFR